MGSLFGKNAHQSGGSLVERSLRSLRGKVAAVGGAAVVSSLAEVGTVAKELTAAERRRRRRQREREEEEDDRKRNDRDDEDDGDDRLSILRARQADFRDRISNPPRRETSRQSADDPDDRDTGGANGEDEGSGSTNGRRTRTEDDGTTESGNDVTEAIQAPQSVEPESPEPATSGAIRIGSGDTFASIDPETGTAIAESNGVRAIAGPEGAFIEGTPGTSSPPPTGGDDGTDGGTRGGTGDGGGTGTGDGDGGDTGDDFTS